MTFRFHRRFRILPGVHLNVGKTGTSWSIGRRGFTVNVRKGHVTRTIGIPGTGMSWRSDVTPHPAPPHLEHRPDLPEVVTSPRPAGQPHAGWGALFVLVAVVALALIIAASHP